MTPAPDPKPPTGLSRPARRLWRDVVQAFELEPWQLVLLEQACRSLTRIGQAEAAIRADGLYVTDRFGQKREHPACETERSNRRLFKVYMRELQLGEPAPDGGYDRAPRLADYGPRGKEA
jgi:phage terminase small subunit